MRTIPGSRTHVDRAWIGLALVQALLAVGYFVTPQTWTGAILYCAAGLAATLGVAAGIVLHAPAPRAAFLVLCAALGSLTIGDAIWVTYDMLNAQVPYPGVADVLYLLAYPLLLVAMTLMLRQSRADAGIALDATIIALGVGVLVWEFLMAPSLRDAGGSFMAQLVSAAYPGVDILLVATLARLLFAGLWRNVTVQLLTLAFLAALTADVVYSWEAVTGEYHAGVWYEAGWMIEYALLGVAVLHPSVRRLGGEVIDSTPVSAHRRLIPLAVAGLIAPATIIFEVLVGREPNLLIVTGIWAVLFVLVVTRMRNLMAALDHLFRQMRYRASHDSLTGLENRAAFTERVEAMLEDRRTSLAVAYLDLDGFKAINDRKGHAAGDELLVAMADRLSAGVRNGDVVARIGGDEFAVLAPGVQTDAETSAFATRLSAVVEDPFVVGDRQLPVTVSLGVALSRPGETFDALMSRADAAMYRMKAAHRAQSPLHVVDELPDPGAAATLLER